MENTHLDAPLFIKEKREKAVDIAKTPFFYNDGGTPTYLTKLPPRVKSLPELVTNPNVAIGNEYVVNDVLGVKKTPPYGMETQLGFLAEHVVFEPMWVTPAIAAAFGIILVKPGQAVRMHSPVTKLSQVEYEYGVFAGHWSPYQNVGNKLLSVVCTDLEHHDFPHVFASVDPLFPLVTSVARYWPHLSKIRVADLWVPRGCALYIPPKPAITNAECIDLHNNRNSAHACWGDIHHDHVTTKTLLQMKHGFFYWYWNPLPTVHPHVKNKEQ
jgi:hypothetical protein